MPRAAKEGGASNVWQDLEARKALADPAVSLPLYGTLISQEDGQEVLFDPHRITDKMQATIVGYMSNPPVDENGFTLWLSLLGYRQGGKSLTAELAAYPLAAYTPGFDHVCIADVKDRADYLHERTQFCHKRWPDELRTPQRATNEVRQLTFVHDAKMRVLSGHAEAVGIGQSVDSFHGSELPYWKNAARQFSLINPSMLNRKHARMLLESTPSPLSEPSAQWWQDKCRDAKYREARNLYAFFPFWDGRLNVRPWPTNAVLETDEIRMLERYGPLGLKKEHLAFRRYTMAMDPEIRRNPDLFRVYYPFDDVTCWLSTTSGVIKPHVIERHLKDLRPFKPPYTEFEPPEPGALYAIGADPAGYGARDHASFQVLKCYADDWTQVAVFAASVDPVEFYRHLSAAAHRYNNALVGIERNGVGVGTIALFQKDNYGNLYHDTWDKPGVHKSSHDQMVSILIDHLLDRLRLVDEDTVSQLQGYQSDKAVERTIRAELLSNDDGRRRARHHWDKVSALMMACITAESLPRRFKKEPDLPKNVVPFNQMSWDALQAYEKKVAEFERPRQNRRAHYRSIRRRR